MNQKELEEEWKQKDCHEHCLYPLHFFPCPHWKKPKPIDMEKLKELGNAIADADEKAFYEGNPIYEMGKSLGAREALESISEEFYQLRKSNSTDSAGDIFFRMNEILQSNLNKVENK